MQRQPILNYIEKKKEYIDNDYKLYFIFEVFFLPENSDFYRNKVFELERKMDERMLPVTPYKMKNFIAKCGGNNQQKLHMQGVKLIHSASRLGGFTPGNIALIDTAFTDESKEEKSNAFLESFETLVKNSKAIPSNSVIILSQKPHHMEKLKRKALEQTFTVNEKKRRVAAETKGQKTITDYFKTVKATSSTAAAAVPKSKAKAESEISYKVEEIIQEQRGCENNIKILWMPKNDELNPVNYLSVYFCKEVADLLEVEDMEPIEACKHVLDTLPDGLWIKILSYIEKLEEEYVKEFAPKKKREEAAEVPNEN